MPKKPVNEPAGAGPPNEGNRFRPGRSGNPAGRPLADPRDQLLQARALTGKAIQPETPHKTSRGALMADGTGVAINVRAYADPDLEAVRTAVTDTEVVQAIGRGRGVNRDAEQPLTVWLLADVVTPLPVDNLVRWEDVRLSPVGRMLARGIALLSPRDAHLAFPWLASSMEAAKKALARDFGDIPLWVCSHRGMSRKSLPEVRYRPTGRGQQTRRALVLPAFLPESREWLEEQFGELGLFEVVAPDAGRDEAGTAFAGGDREGPSANEKPPSTAPEAPADVPDLGGDGETPSLAGALLDPDAATLRAEVPSRPGADMHLRVVMPDGSFRPVHPPHGPDRPSSPDDPAASRSRSMWDTVR